MKKTVFIIIVLTIAAKVLGFGREIVLAFFYGASNVSDAYLIALTIPQTIFIFISTGISTGYIPIYSSIVEERGIDAAERFTSNVINILLIISTLVVILGLIFVVPLVKLFASGFQGETLKLAISFTQISLAGVYFSGLTTLFTAYLQIRNNFHAPVLMGIPFNLIIMASIAMSYKTNSLILLIGTILASFAQMMFLIIYVRKTSYKYHFSLGLNDIYIKRMLYLALPLIIGVSVNQINVLVGSTLASQIATGGISALNYADRLNIFIQAIFVTSIVSVMYPSISKMAVEKNYDGFKKSLTEAINMISLLIIPLTVGSMLFASQIVRMLFGRGAFESQAVLLTSSALFFYSIGMIGFGLREVLSRAFYSMQDTKTPMINAALGILLNIILSLFLSRYMGIGGLALAASIAALFTTGLLFISLRKKIGKFGIKQICISFLKILIASTLMGIISKLSYNYLICQLNQSISLLIAIAIGMASYSAIIYFMRIEDVDEIVKMVKGKLGKGV